MLNSIEPVQPHSVELLVGGYRQEDDLLYVDLPAGNYVVDEKPITIKLNEKGVIVDMASIDNIFRIHSTWIVDRVINADTKEEISLTEYNKRKLELMQNCIIKKPDDEEDGDEEIVWKTVEDRFKYELFITVFTFVRKEVFNRQKVKVVIHGEPPNNSNQWIIPIRKISGDLRNTLYVYERDRHARDLVVDLFLKNGWRELDQEPPLFSKPKDQDRTFFIGKSLSSSKMFSSDQSTEFITINIPTLKGYEKGRTLTGTFKELEARFNEVEIDVNDAVMSYFNRKKLMSSFDDVTVGEVLNLLHTAREELRKVESMKKTQGIYSSCSETLRKLAIKIKSSAGKM